MMRNVEQVTLASGELISIRDGRAVAITVIKGRVWVTTAGDQRDVFYGPGANFAVSTGGHAVVEALRDTELQVRVEPGFLGSLAASILTTLAYRALNLRQRVTGLRLSVSRAATLPGGVAACRDGGC